MFTCRSRNFTEVVSRLDCMRNRPRREIVALAEKFKQLGNIFMNIFDYIIDYRRRVENRGGPIGRSERPSVPYGLDKLMYHNGVTDQIETIEWVQFENPRILYCKYLIYIIF